MSGFRRQKVSQALEQASQRGGGFSKALMYDLVINANKGSFREKLEYEDEDGKTKRVKTLFDTVIILGELEELPLIIAHPQNRERMDSDEKKKPNIPHILSPKTFGIKECEVSDYYYSFPKDKRRKSCAVGSNRTYLEIPVLLIGRQEQEETGKGNIISDVRWFRMETTSYIDECKQNYNRLALANAEYPVEKYIYKISKADLPTGENGFKPKSQFFFTPVSKIGPKAVRRYGLDQVDHPLISNYLDTETGKFERDDEYYDDLFKVACLRYNKFVHPETMETAEYGGLYDDCVERFEELLEEWPGPAEVVDQDEDEEDDD